MLILTRRIGEALRIGRDVQVIVLSQRGNQVRIGIQAPRSVAVHRAEVFERIHCGSTGTVAPPATEVS
jgi:carbon storage regulator